MLKDYKSEKLDLDNPDVYRNFSKPVGVQNPDNEDEGATLYSHVYVMIYLKIWVLKIVLSFTYGIMILLLS